MAEVAMAPVAVVSVVVLVEAPVVSVETEPLTWPLGVVAELLLLAAGMVGSVVAPVDDETPEPAWA
ncbi:hypothetical protein DJ021_16920 [Phenylobacterium hankyongense]|uniref:Uncharacterized protein n=1 Tax=Phenylobacterium hankyongense TaxID=1813876 RepID=A0A328B469_9CAUL|nr:hypothetical protein DJ021_16920 [Phenylobacterium hankyongense]